MATATATVALVTSTTPASALEDSAVAVAASTSSELLRGTPFESPPNAAALAQLMRGGVVRRSSSALTSDDWMRLHQLGFERDRTHSAVVVLRFIPNTNAARAARQVDRLRNLARSLDGFASSNACDHITSEGDNAALCTGSVDGPVGKVPVRMGVVSALSQEQGAQGGNGSLHLLLRNARSLEAKSFLSWGRIVDPNHLKVAIDLYPVTEGWFVYTRVAVHMSAHESSAKTISDTLLRLDEWLCRDLTRLR